jgi:four helix bundle protein
MPILPYKNPLGYKELRTWQQANEILELTEGFIKTLPHAEPARTHMDRSARSTVRNIEEGFRRTTTNEYVSFLGFSAGSNEELLGDFEHCLRAGRGDKEGAEKGFRLCKGESTMLHRQIMALQKKVEKDGGFTQKDKLMLKRKEQQKEEEFMKSIEKYQRKYD